MKRIFLVAMMIAISLSFGKAQTGQPIKKVAILEVVDRDNSVNYGVKLLLRTCLAKAITQTHGYEGYDRVDMGAIQGEQDFQRTGMVSDAEIRKLGEMTGAAYVLVAEAAKLDESLIIVTAKILDVETAKLEKTDYEQMGVNAKDMADGCRAMASRLFSSSGMAKNSKTDNVVDMGDDIMLELGSKVIRKGARLFVEDKYMVQTKMSEVQARNYLGNYFSSWQSSRKSRVAGISLLATGSVFFIAGGSVLLEEELYVMAKKKKGIHESYREYMIDMGIPFCVVGIGLIIAGIPTYVIAEKKMDRILQAVEDQQDVAPYRTSVSLNVGGQSHGFGLGLRF